MHNARDNTFPTRETQRHNLFDSSFIISVHRPRRTSAPSGKSLPHCPPPRPPFPGTPSRGGGMKGYRAAIFLGERATFESPRKHEP